MSKDIIAGKPSRLPPANFSKHQDCEHYRPCGHEAGLCHAHPPLPMLVPGMNPRTGKTEPQMRMFYPEVRGPDRACGEFCQGMTKLQIPDIDITTLPLTGAN